MCIIVALEPRKKISNEDEIPKKVIKICWENNPDGAGFMYVKDNKVRIYKHMKFKPFYRAFQNARFANQNSRFVLHFRKASVGNVSIENCHPFWIRKNKTALVHNGTIIDLKTATTNTEKNEDSDSKKLCNMLSDFPADWMTNKAIVKIISSYVGRNKIVILDKNNTLWTFNPDDFIKDGKILYSNESYKPKKVKTNVYPIQNYNNRTTHQDFCNTSKVDFDTEKYLDLINNAKRTIPTITDQTSYCLVCKKPLFYKSDLILNICSDCRSPSNNNIVLKKLNTKTCSLCKKKIIYPTESANWATEICEDCSKLYINKFYTKKTTIIGQKILELEKEAIKNK